MKSFDVVVVGGGPAGAACSRRLVQAGLDVLVLDKALFPRQKACAGWVTPGVFASLDINPRAYGANRLLQPITGFRSGLLGRPQVLNRYDDPVSYALHRPEFDQYLLQSSGARVVTGEEVGSITPQAGRWLVNGRYSARMLVGAGGHGCPVAKLFGAVPQNQAPQATVQEVEWELSARQQTHCLVEPRVPELFFCDDFSGYGWCLRKGNLLNIGFGVKDPAKIDGQLATFVSYLKRQGKIPPDASSEQCRTHTYGLYGTAARRYIADGMVLIGDAAGLACQGSGEGIRTAVESGLFAAEAILEAQGDYRAAQLEGYRQRVRARFGPENAAPRSVVPVGAAQFLARLVFADRRLTRHLVLERFLLQKHRRPVRVLQETANRREPRVALEG